MASREAGRDALPVEQQRQRTDARRQWQCRQRTRLAQRFRQGFRPDAAGRRASTGTPGTATNASNPATPANAATPPDGNPGKATPRPTDGEAAATDASTSTPAVPATSAASDDKDTPANADDAPWPPLGLAGLMLAVPTGVDPAPVLPPPAASDA
ncbi:hypothetical protein B0X78_18600, partial [bacterium AM6]